MLDLDFLAKRRAQTLNQSEDTWKKLIWSQDFQKILVSMSDSEVEALLELCGSVTQLEKVVYHLKVRSEEMGVSPYSVLEQEAQSAGLSTKAWIKSQTDGEK